MASKFMAFEGVASPTYANADGNERIEMNTTQYTNYQSNANQEQYIESGPYGAVDNDNDLDENAEEKCDKSIGYRKFIYNNSEQFKSICGGLFLMMGSGIHIVWGIFRVFDLYRCHEENSFYLRFVIWSWYFGAIIGNCVGGRVVQTMRKGHLYFICGAMLIKSGMLLALSDGNESISLLLSRILGGIAHGLAYVVIIVHASENATKDFREFLLIVVGVVMNYSILISALAFFHTEGLFNTGILNGIGLFAFGVCTMVVTAKHATETVPFILQNNGSEMDALQTVSKLKKKPIAAQSVHHDFLTMKNVVQDEMDHYGTPSFLKILLPENRKSLVFCFYGRLCSVLSFNLPLIVMIMLFLRGWVDGSAELHGVFVESHCPSTTISTNLIHLSGAHPPIVTPKPTSEMRPKRETPNHTGAIEHTATEKVLENIGALNRTADHPENKHGKENDEKSHDDNKSTQQSEQKHEANDGEKSEAAKAKEKQKHETKNGGDNNVRVESINSDSEKSESKNGVNDNEKINASDTSKQRNAKNERDNVKATEHQPKSRGRESPQIHGKAIEIEPANNEHGKETDHSKEVVEVTFFAHLITFLHSRELTLVLFAWFIFGTLTVAILYTLNLRCYIYYISCVMAAALALTGLANSFQYLSAIFHLCLIIYFNYVTIPIDVFGHCMLAEAFPITLKAYSIAGIAALEHFVHIIVIGLYMTEWFHNSIILLMCIVSFVAHEIARNLPHKTNLPLGEARELYQNIDLMLFNEPTTTNNHQQEFI